MNPLVERVGELIKCRCEPDSERVCDGCDAVGAVDDEIERLRLAVAFGVECQKALEDARRELAEARGLLREAEGDLYSSPDLRARIDAFLAAGQPAHAHIGEVPHVVATLCPTCFQDIPPGHPDAPVHPQESMRESSGFAASGQQTARTVKSGEGK